MKRIVLINILILNLSVVFSQWQKGNGPYGGIVKCLTKSDTYIVAGCNWNESGVFVSADFGDTWRKVVNTDKPSYQTPDISVNSIVQGSFSDVFYVGSSGEGIYKLFLNNGTWNLRTIGFRSQSKSITSVAYSKGNIFAAFFGDGIYKTSDEGQNWYPINNGLSSKNVADLKFSGDSIFAGTTDGLYISKNMGVDWNLFSTELSGKYITDVFLQDTIICLGVFNEGTYSFSKKGKLLSKPVLNNPLEILPIGLINGKLYGAHTYEGLYSTDIPNINWQKTSSVIDGQWPLSIIENKGTLLLGVHGFGVYKSKDKGITWNESSVGISAYKFNSIGAIDSMIYATTDISGAFLSRDNGKTWQRIKDFGTSAGSLLVKDSVIFLSSDKVYVSYDKGSSWKNTGVPGGQLASNGGAIYSASMYSGINSTGDKGKTWQHVNFKDSVKLIFDMDVSNSIILVGTQTGGAFYSSNNGKSWSQINNGLDKKWIIGVLIKDTSFFVTTGSNGVYRSSNYGQTWELKKKGLSFIPSKLIKHDSIIFGTFPTHGTYSSDNGENWITLSELPGLSAISSNKNCLFAGTYDGFYYHKIDNLSTNIVERDINRLSMSNYPNPFSENTTINYTLDKNEERVILLVYDNQGRIVYSLKERNKSAGKYSVQFNSGKLTSGLYFYRLITSNGSASSKMIINK